jgi:hypothetical protein
MPKGKPHKSAPTFTSAELALANDCARLIWHGISFETGKPIVSDEELLSYFATPLHRHLTSSTAKVSLNLNDLHSLIITCGLKPMLRKQHELSYPQFENYLAKNTKTYLHDCNAAKQTVDAWRVSSAYVMQGGKELVDVAVQTNAGYRIPLATRILFFALPSMPLANFSNGLAKALNLQSRPEAAINPFYQIFQNCLAINRKQLSKYQMPQSLEKLENDIYIEAKSSDWWQRRVVDIALLLHFNVSRVITPLPTIP